MMNLIFIILMPLLLNFLNYINNFDYFVSCNFILGGLTLTLFLNSIKVFNKDNWKLFIGISVFSNIFTLLIEITMLHFDVWSFSNKHQILSGYTFLGAPIEEFNFWMYCPWLVGFCYIILSKSKINKIIDPKIIENFSLELASWESKHKLIKDSLVNYTEEVGKTGSYTRGRFFPIYLSVQIFMFAMIIYLKKYYHGNRKSLWFTTIFFFLTMMPYEQYAISQGFWIYNTKKVIGAFFLKVPIEGWLMYLLPPIAGSIFTDVLNKKFFKKDI